MLDRIATKEAIAEVLGVQARQIDRYASVDRPRTPIERRYRDPLRLVQRHGIWLIRAARFEAWRNRNLRDGANEPRVYGSAIRALAEIKSRSAFNLAVERDHDPLPVVRPTGTRPWAYVSAVEEWLDAQTIGWGVRALLRKV